MTISLWRWSWLARLLLPESWPPHLLIRPPGWICIMIIQWGNSPQPHSNEWQDWKINKYAKLFHCNLDSWNRRKKDEFLIVCIKGEAHEKTTKKLATFIQSNLDDNSESCLNVGSVHLYCGRNHKSWHIQLTRSAYRDTWVRRARLYFSMWP